MLVTDSSPYLLYIALSDLKRGQKTVRVLLRPFVLPTVKNRNRIREKAERLEEQQYRIQESRFETAVIG
ncbi:uncharacterized protein LAJ45_04552 [Morchella importuna]|uniref:uncharacterized protein n=1 Tax=Morchella importuna TaxID=1174673 RepID=UPI001E8CB8CF|nr:uncharacterized protein LAJ45_04552 [Morchella importuna]KAH8151350.1 hypothetical protein LAJ45_04552 [Morchella importuna]